MEESLQPALGKPKATDPCWCAKVLRPASVPFIKAAYRIGMSANMVSLALLPVTFLALVLIAIGNWWLAILGALLMNFVALGDCIDGSVARLSGTSGPAGEWMDAMVGYTVYGLLPLAVGFRAYHAQGLGEGLLSPDLILLLGAATGIFNLYSRVLYQKYINVLSDQEQVESSKSGKGDLYTKGMTQLGFVGFMMPLLLLAVMVKAEIFYIVFYFLLYAVFCLSTLVVLIWRVLRAEVQ